MYVSAHARARGDGGGKRGYETLALVGLSSIGQMLGKRDNLSMRCLADVLETISFASVGNSSANLGRQVSKETNCQTPMGPLFIIVKLPLKSGGQHEWEMINPCALVWALCAKYGHYASFIKSNLGRIKGRLSFYTDEAVAGNPKGHNTNGRTKLQCLYFTFCELPDWFRSRYGGWLPLGYLAYKHQRNIKGDGSWCPVWRAVC